MALFIGVIALTVSSTARPADARSPRAIIVEAQDRCDPATFNAALGPDACHPIEDRGTTTFEELLEETNPTDFGPDSWRFSRTNFSIQRGDWIRVLFTGGEAHSFSRVNRFGRGCVNDLNAPLGLPLWNGTPDATLPLSGNMCPAAFGDIRGPGAEFVVDRLPKGTHRFQCVIHPWMRSTVTVE